jgi:acyl-coenzyme A thioesterase PaaI-like protein
MPIGVRVGPALPPHPEPIPQIQRLLGIERTDDGAVRMPIAGVAVNPLGFLHGGLSGLLVAECAAIRGYAVTSMMLRYLGPVREGCARAFATEVPDTDEQPLLKVEISDDTGRPGAIATARLRRR